MIIPYPIVRNLFVQKELYKVHAHWTTTLQEYDLEIKLAKIIRGQGLCQMDSEVVADDGWKNETTMYKPEFVQVTDVLES